MSVKIGCRKRGGSHLLPGDICICLQQALKAQKSIHVTLPSFHKERAFLAHFWQQSAKFPGGPLCQHSRSMAHRRKTSTQAAVIKHKNHKSTPIKDTTAAPFIFYVLLLAAMFLSCIFVNMQIFLQRMIKGNSSISCQPETCSVWELDWLSRKLFWKASEDLRHPQWVQ